ncbi:uncharacterized protein JCM15063_004194 [Sporobolomyces koalae]|uniref:uncharacterized protein n=1 Tax=Sporobolomyces koalae TaxID=500713 RepID=UPI003175DEB6
MRAYHRVSTRHPSLSAPPSSYLKMDKLQPITRNLPAVVRDSLEALLGEECYTTLVYNTNLHSTECLKLAVSKLLGVGIIAGGAIVKVPQILTVLSAKSARGLSLSSYLLDTAATAITVAYNVRNGFPLSTYGEMVFLLAQNAILIGLIAAYTPGPTLTRLVPIAASFSCFAYSLSSSTIVPSSLLATLQTLTIPLSLSSKVPQIVSNARLGSTGQLSAFLVFNSLAGCLARVFTSITETNDPVLIVGFAGAALLNAVLALQFFVYRNHDSAVAQLPSKRQLEDKVNAVATETKRKDVPEIGIGRASTAGEGTPARKPTPSRTSSPRYVRKLD